MAVSEAPPSWGKIILITAGTAVVAGLILGLATTLLGVQPGMLAGGVGGATGMVGALLISRRRAMMAPRRRR
jgi:hypothetical protein